MTDNVEQITVEKPRITKMITQPSKQFKGIKKYAIIQKPLFIIIGLTILGGMILTLSIDVATSPELSAMSGRELFDVYAFNIVNSVILVIITALFYTLVHLMVAKVIKAEVTFARLFSMNVHIALIPAIALIVNAILLFIINGDTELVTLTSLEAIFQRGGILGAALNSVDVFMIWEFILMAIGLQMVGNFSKKASWTVVMLFYFLLLTLDMSVAQM